MNNAERSRNNIELCWFGKYFEDDPKKLLQVRNEAEKHSKPYPWPYSISQVERRLLEIDIEKSVLPKGSESQKDIFDNFLIHGDNLLALKALEEKFTGRVKCIYIDPPYNTGNAFDQYNDNLEHSTWLSLMKPRLEMLRKLLKSDGSIWISIDDDEYAYLKVLCDEIFGRSNYIETIVWQRAYAPVNLKKTLSRSHDYIIVYAKNKTQDFAFKKLPRSEEANSRYKNPDNDPRGVWKNSDLSVGPRVEQNVYEITTPSGRVVLPPDGYSWRLSKERFAEYVADNRIWFGTEGNNVPSIKRFLSEVKDGIVAQTLWTYQEVGHTQDAKREVKAFNSADVFATPKPERLIERILTLATNEGDLVLDSFLGSGTTAAVAHKMHRRFIGIEMGSQCYTHSKVRLDAVISGQDKGGVTESQGWTCGGGYKFLELAPSLCVRDENGIYIINPAYEEEKIVASVAKLHGFVKDETETNILKKFKRGEHQFLFATRNYLTKEILQTLVAEFNSDDTLFLYLACYDAGIEKLYKDKITIEKIPQSLLRQFDFDRTYPLNINDTENSDE